MLFGEAENEVPLKPDSDEEGLKTGRKKNGRMKRIASEAAGGE